MLTNAYEKIHSPWMVNRSNVPPAISSELALTKKRLPKSSSRLRVFSSRLRIFPAGSGSVNVVNVVLQVLLVIVSLRTVGALLILDLTSWVIGTSFLMGCQVFLSIKGLGAVPAFHHFLFIMCFEVAV